MRKRIEEIVGRFPGAKVAERVPRPMGGFDMQLRVEAPPGQLFDVLDYTSELVNATMSTK